MSSLQTKVFNLVNGKYVYFQLKTIRKGWEKLQTFDDYLPFKWTTYSMHFYQGTISF